MLDPLKVSAAATRSGIAFGVQLYMVRDMVKDLASTFRLLHEIGYSSVETFPVVYDLLARELKVLINQNGLTGPSGHFDYETLEERVDYAAELGLEYMICPAIPVSQRTSIDGFHEAAKHLNQAAMKAQSSGLKFGYHAHNYEYKVLGGETGFDVLMRELDPSVKLELDIFWAVEAGQNPQEMMRKHRDRLALIHIKDRKPVNGFTFVPDEHAAHFTEAGVGTIDWKTLLGEAKRLGVRQFFVDQDGSDLPIDQSLLINWNYLSRLSF
ncbi:MAG: sugar phosphate isomerase/epimerase [Terriglobales bacterium]